MAKLTKAEKKWLDELQEVLNRCPSKRLGFYTIGDPYLGVIDASRLQEIEDEQEENGGEFCMAASKVGADFAGYKLDFPNQVHSTAG
ncbi:Uncharacterised protein [Serratia entomophila]|uniref:hypothetical protein n=1 Tax=Serratia entomophila TaxID=42906 RepID=UPI001F216A20|nr:hypothetical protein [Serratia entomophila]UIW19267.1 hypothetical protein KHA73_04770 [Serratia entomophila]CAI0822590.1 Uncharacterised protein [Serratia entomophila]CAI0825457.1 Uncharacterised protein [Serratia entomophila]CAI0846244.1 Uncharacterised protein [Serratia entomophila]CAI0875934.1 Uncharacterised protein [Serratia entomophila]